MKRVSRYGLNLLPWKDSESHEIASDLSVCLRASRVIPGGLKGIVELTNQHTLSLVTNWKQITVGRQLDTSELYLTTSLHLVAKISGSQCTYPAVSSVS